MAPIRKSKNLNKLSFRDTGSSPTKDGRNGDKNRQEKRNDSAIGSQWSKQELTLFYKAYRKYGKNWKKVAHTVRTRSAEMVEGLYNMNKAYLSLPEGTASVAGLIAMMTDHYNILDSDESERESNEETKISRKPQKSVRGKSRARISKGPTGHVQDLLQSQAAAPNYGCLSLLKNRCSSGDGPRIVGKRTPRFPVSHPRNKGDVGKYLSPSTQDPYSEQDDADQVAEGMLALTKALEGAGSSQTRKRRPGQHAEAGNKPIGVAKRDSHVGNLEIRETANGHPARACDNKVEVCRKRKQFPKEKPNDRDSKSDHSAGKGTQKMNKRSKHQLSEDETFALDALSILADALPKPEAMLTFESGPEVNGDNHTMCGEDSTLKAGFIPEAKQRMHLSSSRKKKRKHKSLSSNIPEAESAMDSLSSEQQKTEIPKANSLVDCLISEQPKVEKPQQKSVVPHESAHSKGDMQREENHLALPSIQVPSTNQVNLPTKLRSKRKMKSPKNIGNGQSLDYSSTFRNRKRSPKDEIFHCLSSPTLQRWCAFEWFYSAIDYPWFARREFVEYLNHVGLGHVPKLTRVEWGVIRSSLGKPRRLSQQFLREEKDKLEQYRQSVRTHYAQLRSGVMDAVPSDLARPLRVGQRVIARHPKTRGISDGSILTVERDKCRVQFDRVDLGVELVMDIDCMPCDMEDSLPETLRKQHITVAKEQEKLDESLHPKMIGHMMCALSENLVNADGSSFISPPAELMNSSPKLAKGDATGGTSQEKATPGDNYNPQEVTHMQPCNLGPHQSSDADIRALSDLSRALDKKEALVSELRYMNGEVLKNQSDGDGSLKDSELFKKQYASVIQLLQESNDQVSAALLYLKQRNTYQENSPRPWLRPAARSCSSAQSHSYFSHSAVLDEEAEPNVVEIVESSKSKARKMVDAAAKAMSSLKEGEDVYMKVGEALEYSDSQDFGIPADSSTSDHHDLLDQNPTTSEMTDVKVGEQTTDSKVNHTSDVEKVQIPSALISSCVAALLMIQKCTERQYPPGEAVEILDSAMTNLQPCCSQNLPIYRDIQMCMGMVKNQLLALIPT